MGMRFSVSQPAREEKGQGSQQVILLYPVFSQPMISEQGQSQTRKPAIPKSLFAVPEDRVQDSKRTSSAFCPRSRARVERAISKVGSRVRNKKKIFEVTRDKERIE